MEKNQLLREFSFKLDESIEEHRELKEKLERANLFRMPTPDKVKMFEESFTLIRMEQSEKLEKLNLEILT